MSRSLLFAPRMFQLQQLSREFVLTPGLVVVNEEVDVRLENVRLDISCFFTKGYILISIIHLLKYNLTRGDLFKVTPLSQCFKISNYITVKQGALQMCSGYSVTNVY